MSSIIVNVRDLTAGLVLAEDILNPVGQPLVCRGTKLSERMIQVIRERGYADFLRVRLTEDGEDDFDENGDMRNGGVPHTLVRKVRKDVGDMIGKARQTSSLSRPQVERLASDIAPVIRALFDGPAPIFDNICVLSDHDDYTHQHSWMVMIMSLAVLRGAWDRGFIYPDAQFRLDTGLGAVLHDLGKIHIPLEVLNKPGKLTREEWELIKAHPEKGYAMIRDTESLMPLAKAIVAHHHQYLDGSGYGPGDRPPLSGEDIPDLVRLTTVVDVYDALVSERPYRLAYLPFQALRFLDAHSRTRFDDRFVHVLRMTVVDFPKGALLLFPHGLVGCVTQNFPKQKENPEILIMGALCRNYAHLIGKQFRLQEPPTGLPSERHILLGAATIQSLAEKIRREARVTGLSTLIASREERTLVCHAQWEELFEKHLGFVTSDDFAMETPEPVMQPG